MKLTEFLEARIADDEAAVERRGSHPHSMHGTDIVGTYNPGCPDCLGLRGKARVAAECQAKRTLMYLYKWGPECEVFDGVKWTNPLEVLAAVYADHPDYDKGWAL